MKKNLIASAAVLAALAGGVGYGAAGANASGDHRDPQQRSTTARALTTTPIACDGGANIGLKTRIVNRPFTFSEAAVNGQDQALPGAAVTLVGPARGTDTLLVTVSGETRLNNANANGNDWMGIEVKDNGVNIEPYTAVGDVMALTGENSYNLNSGQFCVKIGPGVHRLKTFVNIQDNNGGALSGWVDDYTFSVQRFR